MSPRHIIYVHGFLSSSQSDKACELGEWLSNHQLPFIYHTPTLSDYPAAAMAQLCALVERLGPAQTGLIGSSLGGFYATWLAQRYGVSAVLVNPVVRPHRLIANYLGEQLNPYTGARFTLTQADLQTLASLVVPSLDHPDKLLLMLQTGDQTLDYREAVTEYALCPQLLEAGGDHRFSGFGRYLPEVTAFLSAPHY